MNDFFRRKLFIRQNLPVLIGLCLCFYFSYHSIYGDRSFLRLMSLSSLVTQSQAEYDGIKTQRIVLERKVAAMRPGSLSKDMLEERARVLLGYRRVGEMEIVRP